MEAPAARGGARMQLRLRGVTAVSLVVVLMAMAMAASTARAQLQVGVLRHAVPGGGDHRAGGGQQGGVRQPRHRRRPPPAPLPRLLRQGVRRVCAAGLDAGQPGGEMSFSARDALALRGFEVIDAAKTRLEQACYGVVSCADVLAFAARDALALVGGSSYQVPAGRKDGNVSVAGETNGNLPPPTANVNQLNQIFGSKGLSQAQMVALSGAHTVGMAQCSSFSNRLYSYGPSGGRDPSMDPSYLATLSTQCPQSGGAAGQLVAMDPVTPNTFDTNYYANVAANRGLLASDQALLADNSTAAQVVGYTTSPGTFQTDFANAMVAMGAIGVLTGNTGSVRTNCRVVG